MGPPFYFKGEVPKAEGFLRDVINPQNTLNPQQIRGL